jgi:hypothetical protein
MLVCSGADRLNERFVILSESCIPLYPAAFLYMQLLHESKSRVWFKSTPECATAARFIIVSEKCPLGNVGLGLFGYHE